MLGGRWNGTLLGRVNPLVPLAVIAIGAVVAVFASRPVGAGLAIGAVLAFLNSLLLSRRVDFAAATGDMGRALMIMQLGMFTTFGIIAVATIVLVRISLAMAVASAAGFVLAQLSMLAVFYWTRARADVAAGRQAT